MLGRFLAPCAVALAVVATPVAAQQDTTRARDTAAVRLPTLDVTATATRSTRRPMEQPLAMTAVAPQAWQGARGHSLDEALTFVPGVLAQSRYGGTDIRLTIRGFGSRGAGDRSNSGTSRGVRVLTDGFPDTEPDGRTSFDLIDLAAATGLEIVRSNASSVWGNAAGGVVSISTLRRTDRAYGEAEGAAGSFGFRRLVTRLGAPLGGGQAGLTLTRTVTAGWRNHADGERTLATLGLTTPLAETGRLGVFVSATDNSFRIPGPLTRAEADATPRVANATYLARDERRRNRLGRLGVVYEHHAGDHEFRGTLFVQPKFLERSERGTFRNFTRYHVGGSLLYRLEHRVGDGVTATLSAGVDEAYQDGAILFYSLGPDGGRGGVLRTNKREGANNFGVFVQEELRLGRTWGITAGARFDDITYYVDDFLPGGLSGSRSFDRVTPKLGINYRRTPTHSFYLSVGGGVEAPAGNETDPAGTFGQDSVFAINPLLDPVLSTSWELGTKQVTTFGDGASPWVLSYDAALYYTAVTNEVVPYRGGRFYFTAGRAGRAGAELGGQLLKGEVSAQGALSLTRYRYLEYTVDSVHYGRPGALADYGDNTVVGSPAVTWAAGLGWRPGWAGGVQARATAQGISDSFADDANQVEVPGYTLVGLTLALDRPLRLGRGGPALRGAVAVANLLDRRYIASSFLNPDVVGGVPVAFEPGTPRSVTVTLTVGWP